MVNRDYIIEPAHKLKEREAASEAIIEKAFQDGMELASKALKATQDNLRMYVHEAGFSMNAVVPANEYDFNEDGALLPDTLFIGDLISKDGKESVCPALLPFAGGMATGFMINGHNNERISVLMQMLSLRLMLSLPAGMFKFSFIDLHSFGQSQKYISRLSPKIMEKSTVSDKKSLDSLLTDLEETIRRLNKDELLDFPTLQEFNKDVSNTSVPYRFVFISHMHEGLDKSQIERITALCSNRNASNAGVFLFYSLDPLASTQYGVSFDEIINMSLRLIESEDKDTYEMRGSVYGSNFEDNYLIKLDCSIADNHDKLIDEIGKRAELMKPRIISFDSQMEDMISTGKFWSESSIEGIKIPIGMRGTKEIVYLTIAGKTNDYFAMVGGRPGYGKTVLLHNIICNGSILYSPDELEFYLIDCTNGTGFKPYENLPHASFVSITRQREYTDSALDNLVKEMYRRADLFKAAGEKLNKVIEKIETYRDPTEGVGVTLPRIVVIIDEFQVLLEKSDRLARKAKATLEKIIKEGRKYGISIIFCTQSYRDIDFNTELITLRIAFNLKEMDSLKVLGSNNDAATRLVRKGEAIMNNRNGEVEANIYFQGAFTNNMLRYVSFCEQEYQKSPVSKRPRFVFDGKAISDIGLNRKFIASLTSSEISAPGMTRIWVGVPSFIRDEHEFFTIRKGIGSNLLICGNDVKSAITLLALTNYQFVLNDTNVNRSYIFDFFTEGDEPATYLRNTLGLGLMPNVLYCKKKDLKEIVETLAHDLEERIAADNEGRTLTDRHSICLTLAYVQSAQELKKDGYSLSKITERLLYILQNGSDFGIHLLVYSFSGKGFLEIFERTDGFGNKILLSGGKINSFDEIDEIAEGNGLLYTEEKVTTYNPDPFVVYNRCNGAQLDDPLMTQIFSLYNQKND